MRLLVHRLIALLLLLIALGGTCFAQGGTHLYFPGPVGSSAVTGKYQNLQVGPGSVSIVGTGNGGDSITNIANINGQMWANNFSGIDIGAKVNNAIAALGQSGGKIHIAAGQYKFGTTIQCPLTQDIPIIIEGDGQDNLQGSDVTQYNHGTLLQYTGNGDAINQVIVSASGTSAGPYQNFAGCQLRDLTLDGSLAGANAIGFHFGGTAGSGAQMTTISYFKNTAVEAEDPPYQWTERYIFRDTQIFENQTGMYFHADTGAQASFGHGIIHIWVNSSVANAITIKIDGGGLLYSSEVVIDGNQGGLNNIMVDAEGTGTQFTQNFFNPRAECNQAAPGCILTKAGGGAAIINDVLEEQGNGYQSTATTGGYTVNTVLDAQGLGMAHTGTTLFTNEQLGLNLAPRIAHGSVNSRLNLFTIANGASSDVVSSCSGMISVSEQGATGGAGDAGLYMCGGGVCAYLGSSRNVIWVASTTTPAAGHASVAPDGLNYAIYNNDGITDQFGVTSICSRDNN